MNYLSSSTSDSEDTIERDFTTDQSEQFNKQGPSQVQLNEEKVVHTSPLVIKSKEDLNRVYGDTNLRVEACLEFSSDVKLFLSLHSYKSLKRARVIDGKWRPRKGQMVRDMETIFGTDWPIKRGSGGGHLKSSSEPCLLYTSPSPRDQRGSRMPSSA